MLDKVSIIICCYNSEKRLPEALDFLAKQKLIGNLSIELLVIDNNSSDNTQEVAIRHWNELGAPFDLKVIFEGEQGIIYARKTGVKNATGNIILFVDDDNLLCDTYISKGIDLLKNNPNIGILGGFGREKILGDLPKWINPGFPFKSLLNSLAITTSSTNSSGILKGKDDFVFGAASFYRKNIFTKIESLSYKLKLTGRSGDVLMSGEDQELCYIARMMGYELYRYSDIHFQHVIPVGRLNYAYYQKLFYGFGFSSLILKVYSNVLSHSDVDTEPDNLLTQSRVKKSLLDGLYFFLQINKKKFFKLALLSSFEKGVQDYIEHNRDIKRIRDEIEQLHAQLSKI